MRIFYDRPNVFTCAGVRLVPGLNIVDDNKAKAFLAHPAVKARVSQGVIQTDIRLEVKEPLEDEGDDDDVVVDNNGVQGPVVQPEADGAGGADDTTPKPVVTKTVADTIAEIELTYDIHRLRELAADKRKRVADAATKRLKALGDEHTDGDSDGDSAGAGDGS